MSNVHNPSNVHPYVILVSETWSNLIITVHISEFIIAMINQEGPLKERSAFKHYSTLDATYRTLCQIWILSKQIHLINLLLFI